MKIYSLKDASDIPSYIIERLTTKFPRISHPFILKYVDRYQSQNGEVKMVAEFAENGTLS